MRKFLARYPEMKLLMGHSNIQLDKGQPTEKHPAMAFVYKQIKLMDSGYTEEKAFEMVEKEYLDDIDAKRNEMRILRGVAVDEEATSYLSHYQRIAEKESRMKSQRFERDIPKFQRAQ